MDMRNSTQYRTGVRLHMYKIVHRLGLFLTLTVTLVALSGSMTSMAIADGDTTGGPEFTEEEFKKLMKEAIKEDRPNPGFVQLTREDTNTKNGNATMASISTQLKVNPYGCFGHTDNPHKSTHFPNSVNVEAKTQCPIAVPEIKVITQLYVEQCFLFICDWETYGGPGENYDEDVNRVDANSAGSPCVNNTYQGFSYHWIRGADGNTYSGYTWKTADVTTC